MKLGVLFSGGKDSVYATYLSKKAGHKIECLITINSENKESFMFHTPAIEKTKIQSEVMGIPLITKKTKGEKESELEDLENAIKDAVKKYKIKGIVTGAIKSVYQASRIQEICSRLNLECFNPLWQKDEKEYLKELIKENFKVIVDGVFAYPLDEKWVYREIDKKFICELQSLIVENTLKKEIENQIGVYRTLQVYIRGANFIPPKPNDVKKEMNALIKWHKKNKEKLHPVLVASYFHCAFESIHPFADGNGRTGRLLINFILHKAGFPMINIPIKRRLDYYEALETARNGNLRDFIKIIISLMSTKDYII